MRMNKLVRFTAPKRPTNVSLPADLVEEAKRLGINLSQACEAALSEQVNITKREQWLSENMAALESSNAYVEKHGLPLARYRQFKI